MSNMGLTWGTARWLAPASFLYNFAAQQYGMMSDPNMKTIHDNNLSFFSPQPFFIAGFFFPQQLVQLYWLYRMFKLDPSKSQLNRSEVSQMVNYSPYYILGNMCIGTWMFFWNSEQLKTSNVFVIINTFSQLYYMITQQAPMNTASTSSILTHIVSKTFAGIGVLDILHNSSVAYFKNYHPTTLVRVLTGVGFGVGSMFSDWIFGGCLVYDLVALACGQYGSWRNLLGVYALACAGIVTVKNLAQPPYERNENAAYGELPLRENDI